MRRLIQDHGVILRQYSDDILDAAWRESLKKCLGDDALDLRALADRKSQTLGGNAGPMGLGDFFFAPEDPLHPDYDDDEDDEDEEASLSLAAMELLLKDEVLEKFELISSTYMKLHKAQERRIIAQQKGEDVSKSTERTYEKHRQDLLTNMESVRLNNARI